MDNSSRGNDPLLHIERQAKQLQQDLQRYLDAQSEGLLVGLSGGLPEDASSNGSRTPTPSAAASLPARERTVPVRQPPRRKVGLRGARRGIARAMRDFGRLREEENRVLDAQLGERAAALERVDHFVRKREGLEREIGGIQQLEENQRVQELRSGARDVEAEISELENRLSELRSRHRYMVSEASKLENSVQSKVSSYRAALSLLDTEERRFLRRPPIQIPVSTSESSPFSSLSPNRRNLSMAKEHWLSEEDEIRKRKQGVEFERDALQDGGGVWQDVVDEVTTFETMLREEMHAPGSEAKDAATPDGGGGLRDLLQRMDRSVEHLEAQFALAEDQDWKLLVVAIGAELEAFKEGRRVLRDAFDEVSVGPPRSGVDGPAGAEVKNGDTISEADLFGSPELEEGGPPQGATPGALTRETTRYSEDDDEPDPDLLVSHGDE